MDHSVLVSLEDIETGMVYTTHLSSKDAHRVETGKKWRLFFRVVLFMLFLKVLRGF